MSPKISNSTVTLEDSYFLITLQNPKETAMLYKSPKITTIETAWDSRPL